jgi:hypothetical protein
VSADVEPAPEVPTSEAAAPEAPIPEAPAPETIAEPLPVAAFADPRDRPRPAAPAAPLTALPVVTFRQQLLELSWSMALVALFTALATLLWGALRGDARQVNTQTVNHLSSLFFVTVAACWAIMVPAKLWTERQGDSWVRRLVMLLLGGVVGLFACWLDGWSPGQTWRFATAPAGAVRLFPTPVFIEASYICFFALAFFALRWWRMTSRRRSHRFSFAPILGAGFWGLALLLLFTGRLWAATDTPGLSAMVLVLTATVVQLVSPWEPPPPAPARRVRLRHV